MPTISQMGHSLLSVGIHRTFCPATYGPLLQYFLDHGETVRPNGVETKELIDATLTIRQPGDRIIPDRGRKMNLAFAIAEWISYVCGIDDIEYFKQFISNYDRFSTDGVHLDGAYGKRIVYSDYDGIFPIKRMQFEGVIDELRRDPHSRRAVISIFDRDDLYGGGGKNTPCTLNLQFFIRLDRLHMKVNMRSCDVVKGLTYDMFTFSMIQELIARHLDVDLGFYLHNAGSFHLYESDYDLVNKLKRPNWRQRMRPMPRLDFFHLDLMPKLMQQFDDPELFFNTIENFPDEPQFDYIASLMHVMMVHVWRNQDKKVALKAYNRLDRAKDATFRYVLRPWLVTAGVLAP